MSRPTAPSAVPDLDKSAVDRVIERYKNKLAASAGECATILVDVWDLTMLVALAEKGAYQRSSQNPANDDSSEEPAPRR